MMSKPNNLGYQPHYHKFRERIVPANDGLAFYLSRYKNMEHTRKLYKTQIRDKSQKCEFFPCHFFNRQH